VTPGAAALVLALALAGAGSKAGLVPLHVWLPLAHPAAPSHVSALMSGVMTKVAVYGFIRIAFDLLGEPAWWWGGLVLALGGITAVLGVLYALMQHDLKRLLAYHTVENIGIIFIGLGLALAFQANHMYASAALALTAALFHILNHSLFKSLLFFGTGAVLTATGERDMERLGGLIHPMPWTALAFLIGAAAISALPPLNGFVSEWLTFQAILPVRNCRNGRSSSWCRRSARCWRYPPRWPPPASSKPSASPSWVAAFAGRRRGAGDRSLFAGRAVRSGGALPAGRHSARTGGGRPVAGGEHAQWRRPTDGAAAANPG
jgi:hypothetical protein